MQPSRETCGPTREAKLEVQFEKLQEYASHYDEIAADPARRQAVLNGIEHIGIGALERWEFQAKSMELLGDSLHGEFMDDHTVVAKVDEFRLRGQGGYGRLCPVCCGRAGGHAVSQDFSPERLKMERERANKRLKEYNKARSAAQVSMDDRVERMVGNIAAIPEEVDDGYERQNPIFDAVHDAAALANRLTPLAVIGEGRRQTKLRKKNLYEAVSKESPVKDIADAETRVIDRLDFAYNKADSILVDEQGIRFLKKRNTESAAEDEEK